MCLPVLHPNGQNQQRMPKCLPKAKVGQFGGQRARTVSMLGFVGHLVSVVPTQLCHRSAKAAVDALGVSGSGCIPVKL